MDEFLHLGVRSIKNDLLTLVGFLEIEEPMRDSEYSQPSYHNLVLPSRNARVLSKFLSKVMFDIYSN